MIIASQIIVTNKFSFYTTVIYVLAALAGATLNVWIGFHVTEISGVGNFIAAAFCVGFAVWVGRGIRDYAVFIK